MFTGAMEHWGLVTFRETSLLYEEGTSSTVNKQRVATVIAHEVRHYSMLTEIVSFPNVQNLYTNFDLYFIKDITLVRIIVFIVLLPRQ